VIHTRFSLDRFSLEMDEYPHAVDEVPPGPESDEFHLIGTLCKFLGNLSHLSGVPTSIKWHPSALQEEQ
jgi:hypothetical protein